MVQFLKSSAGRSLVLLVAGAVGAALSASVPSVHAQLCRGSVLSGVFK